MKRTETLVKAALIRVCRLAVLVSCSGRADRTGRPAPPAVNSLGPPTPPDPIKGTFRQTGTSGRRGKTHGRPIGKGLAMIRGLYSAATAMDALEQSHEVAAQNLANATVPGYRRRGLTFESMDPAAPSTDAGATAAGLRGTRPTGVYTDFEAGSLQQTGNPLDVALGGKGFFALNGPNGTLYTRNGVFELGPGGELRNKDGFTVQGSSGGIVIPPTASRITISENGNVLADGTEVEPDPHGDLSRQPRTNAGRCDDVHGAGGRSAPNGDRHSAAGLSRGVQRAGRDRDGVDDRRYETVRRGPAPLAPVRRRPAANAAGQNS